MNFYDTDRAVSEYLLFHYGRAEDLLPHAFGPTDALEYPARCVSECLDVEALPENARALDLGCAVGRSTFELARHCGEIIGIDFSQPFIDAAVDLQTQGCADYSYAVEGELRQTASVEIDPAIDRSRVSFEQGDAMDLRDHLGQFDVLLAANLLCRLTEPMKCLERLPGLLNPGGQLLLMTPCTWMEEYTPKENWLGGFERDSAPVRTLDSLKQILGADFVFQTSKDLPFLIREHERKFQWSVAQASVWRRK
ncbi:MAG: putative 4-mercaptohistidine N1-methyltransferase [Candidatus Binatia bacterium]|mgnify:FL=1|jgi:putative 4-mercaptohistidine N1-methyltranferase